MVQKNQILKILLRKKVIRSTVRHPVYFIYYTVYVSRTIYFILM